jgi:hypothetical protein
MGPSMLLYWLQQQIGNQMHLYKDFNDKLMAIIVLIVKNTEAIFQICHFNQIMETIQA